MPVIRGRAHVSVITAEQRQSVAQQLALELTGVPTPSGPVIFEIPFEPQDRIDVLVVWDAWQPFSSTERSDMILAAYNGSQAQIAQALGVTYQEAIEQQVLPYAVMPMLRRGEIHEEDVKNAMLAEEASFVKTGRSICGSQRWPWPSKPIADLPMPFRKATGLLPKLSGTIRKSQRNG